MPCNITNTLVCPASKKIRPSDILIPYLLGYWLNAVAPIILVPKFDAATSQTQPPLDFKAITPTIDCGSPKCGDYSKCDV